MASQSANVCISDSEDLYEYDPRKKAVAVYGDRGSCSPASRCKCNEYVGDVLLHGIVLGPEPEPLAASSSKLGWGCSGGPTIPNPFGSWQWPTLGAFLWLAVAGE